MNITDFTHILQHPEALTEAQTDHVKSIVDEFPYFQAARSLYLKGLKNKQSFKYNQALKNTAAYTTDRSVLFDFITSEGFLQNKISQQIKHNSLHLRTIEVNDLEDISVDKNVTIDDSLQEHIQETEPVLNPALFQPKTATDTKEDPQPEEKDILQFDTDNIEQAPETTLQIGKPFQFEKHERHSFNEWLKLTTFKPIDRPTKDPEKSDKEDCDETLSKSKKFELIDRFISKRPKIKPSKDPTGSNPNIAKERMIQPEALMTETLARIYVEQKNYKKAIQSYKILSLKYPEKSGFFADQIKAIKKIQEKNKEE